MSTSLLVHTDGGRRTGETRGRESWYAGAARLVGRPVFAVDLTGQVKEFSTAPRPQIALRPMLPGDLPMLARWLAEPHVRRWFGGDGEPTLARVEAQYAPDLVEGSGTDLWVVEVQGRSVGFCQDYVVGAHPEYALLTPDPEALGVDYAIGVPAFVGRGTGTRMLSVWAQHARRRHPAIRTFFAAPDHRNLASRRVLRKVGFTEGLWFDEPQGDGSTATVVGHSLDLARVQDPGDALGYLAHDRW